MKKPGQLTAMISSTALDLPEHRERVKDACLREGVFPIGMEHLPAQDLSGIQASLAMVDKADIYIGIYAWRYGWVPDFDNPGKISITEMEFNHAVERKQRGELKEILVFVMHDDHPIRAKDKEDGANAQRKLKAFKKRASAGRVMLQFESKDELHGQVIQSLADLKRGLKDVPTQALRMAQAPPSGEWPTGFRLADRYEILGELGKGGMGRVYKARDHEFDDLVAIKTVLHSGDDRVGSDYEERLLREIQICRKITHPNVVRVYDLGRFPGGIFITMEYLEGPRLDSLIRSDASLPLDKIRWVLAEIATGLEEAHALHIIHRDLKPSNVILAERHLKILDFGVARMAGKAKLTQTGFAVGSPLYMSPEQLQGLPLDGRSDLYALGVLAYTLLTGYEPFSGSTMTVIAMSHLQSPIPDPRKRRPDLPLEWVKLVETLLAKSAEERPADATAALAAIRALPV